MAARPPGREGILLGLLRRRELPGEDLPGALEKIGLFPAPSKGMVLKERKGLSPEESFLLEDLRVQAPGAEILKVEEKIAHPLEVRGKAEKLP